MKLVKFTTSSLLLAVGLLSPAIAQAATLSLSPSSGTFNRGCSYNIEIKVNTNNAKTDAVDATITYDPARFTTSVSSITKGTLYPDLPGTVVDTTNGEITIAALASTTTPVSGSGTVATVAVQIPQSAPTGSTQWKFDFDPLNPAKTTDSNVVETGGTFKDLLTSVTNGTYSIGTGACANAGATNVSATPVASSGGTTTLPNSGFSLPTMLLFAFAGLLLAAGLIGLLLV